MAVLTVRNLPDEVHRALRVRAALRGRSTEAEVRAILAETVLPEGRVGLGSLLTRRWPARRSDGGRARRLCAPRNDSGPPGRSRVILVDTNVISEPLRRVPEPRVAEWLDAQALETLYLSAITVAELRFGARSLPAGPSP